MRTVIVPCLAPADRTSVRDAVLCLLAEAEVESAAAPRGSVAAAWLRGVAL